MTINIIEVLKDSVEVQNSPHHHPPPLFKLLYLERSNLLVYLLTHILVESYFRPTIYSFRPPTVSYIEKKGL